MFVGQSSVTVGKEASEVTLSGTVMKFYRDTLKKWLDNDYIEDVRMKTQKDEDDV